jgi:hypothetical protein
MITLPKLSGGLSLSFFKTRKKDREMGRPKSPILPAIARHDLHGHALKI